MKRAAKAHVKPVERLHPLPDCRPGRRFVEAADADNIDDGTRAYVLFDQRAQGSVDGGDRCSRRLEPKLVDDTRDAGGRCHGDLDSNPLLGRRHFSPQRRDPPSTESRTPQSASPTAFHIAICPHSARLSSTEAFPTNGSRIGSIGGCGCGKTCSKSGSLSFVRSDILALRQTVPVSDNYRRSWVSRLSHIKPAMIYGAGAGLPQTV